MKEVRHYTHSQILNPNHVIPVAVVGCGGTGSQVLAQLARMNLALWSMNHPGFHVVAFDDDIVTEANLGRQLYSDRDVGRHKSIVLIERINRFYGYRWDAVPNKFSWRKVYELTPTFFISCVDSAKTRVEFADTLTKDIWYWLDLGNSRHTAQAILGTGCTIPQPKSDFITASTLPHVVKVHSKLKKVKVEDTEPSCSLAASLQRQDLFINPEIALHGCRMIWKMFRQGFLTYHGLYINLETDSIARLNIKSVKSKE